ncbi:MAG TPA: polysaccharide lyase family protein [Puia sp.]|nr:polysaccharide lyase family protein [Puia sp.]
MTTKCFLLPILLLSALIATSQQPSPHYLWQIGKPDNSVTDLAGAPDKGSQFKKDGVFIVGRSEPEQDWPWAHPGPDDGWAGDRSHSFFILFGINDRPSADSCYLKFRLLDTHNFTRDRLTIHINGHEFTHVLPRGSGQGIYGNFAQAHPYEFNISFPTSLLAAGDNTISITSTAGSWFIYDWLGLETPASITAQPVQATVFLSGVQGNPFIVRDASPYQPAQLSILNTAAPGELTIKITGMDPQRLNLAAGNQQLEFRTPVVTKDSSITIRVEKDNQLIGERTLAIQPVTLRTIYMLPHSHNDIGYTELQTKVENKQIDNLLKGIEYARRTKDYPDGSRFVWNLEGTYVADLFLRRMTPRQKQDFLDALKSGGVALNGMYLNTLTGLCRPEELLRLFKFSTELEKQTGVKVDAAMISDVPGYTWGTVQAMAQAGIKYFSAAPNYFDRIGDILPSWENKPFYWLSQSGKEKLLVWIPYKGYALSHGSQLSSAFVASYMDALRKANYPYGISYIRWSGHGDNAVPEIEISDFVKAWNEKYTAPHFIISSTSRAFHAFEEVYGDRLPTVQGDWTGYWEDGAASSALETAENRASSSRLTQAETLWAMTQPDKFPASRFNDAWRHVLLYSEHTWGADVSVTNPLSQKTIEQWDIKRSYADTAGALSKSLLTEAVNPTPAAPRMAAATPAAPTNAIDVFNTSSWPRTNLVLVPQTLSQQGDLVKDAHGATIPSQRLSTGELAFVASDVPPFASRRYYISKTAKKASAPVGVRTTNNTLDNGLIRVTIDPASGAISSIRTHTLDNNFVDSAAGAYANDYLFLHGSNLADLQHNGPPAISIKEKGPVLSTLLIESAAPGCNKLTREVRLVNGFDYAEMTNILDKQRAELNPHPGDYAWANTGGKESVNFGFPFHVHDGQVRIDIPFSVMRPEKDQIPGSCKNWLEVGEWADVSNDKEGITWVTLDAPLLEVGGITATLLGGQSNPDVWRKKIEPTQKIYSWAINNHWETNYRAYQEGIITFRYALRPHTQFSPAEASRFATGLTQPLVITRAQQQEHPLPLLTVTNKDILVQTLKPSEDGKAYIVTLFNVSDHPASTTLQWSAQTGAVHYSNTTELPLAASRDGGSLSEGQTSIRGDIQIAPWDLVTVRVERP